jgi:hypothetical protein
MIVISDFHCILFFSLWLCSPARSMISSFTRFLDHTQQRATVGSPPLEEWSARRRDRDFQHTQQISMPPVGLFLTALYCPLRPFTHGRSRRAAVDLRLRPWGPGSGPNFYLYLFKPPTIRDFFPPNQNIFAHFKMNWTGVVMKYTAQCFDLMLGSVLLLFDR